MVIAWILKCERGSYSAHTLETRARNANPLTGAIEDHSTGGLAPEKARAASSLPAPRPRVLHRDVHHTRLWGVTRNPWNTEFTPGGSSGGAGAALAAGTTLLAPASGIGGLTRIPAAFTSTVDFEAPHGPHRRRRHRPPERPLRPRPALPHHHPPRADPPHGRTTTWRGCGSRCAYASASTTFTPRSRRTFVPPRRPSQTRARASRRSNSPGRKPIRQRPSPATSPPSSAPRSPRSHRLGPTT